MNAGSCRATGRHVVVWINPRAGSGAARGRIDALADRLRGDGFQVTSSADVEALLKAIRRHERDGQLRVVVAAGGDGTLQRIVGLTTPCTPLLPFPLGTENLVARHFGISDDPAVLAEAVRCGEEVVVDAGRANGQLFLIMASCGFDADVVRRLHAERSGHIRRWSYAPHVIRAMWRYRFPRLQVRVWGGDDLTAERPVEVVARWVFVFNLPRYAMGLPLGTGADGQDGLLDVCTLERGGVGRGLYYLVQVLARRHRRLNDVHWYRGTRISVTATDAETHAGTIPYQLDGDPGGTLPLEVEIVPRRVRLLLPAGSGRGRRSWGERSEAEVSDG